jgi:D-alanyl-D-alanine carboxypeptidase/D-alanyl-D-alanine-endopeptidase (penicillin-binding protein 4)
MRRPSPLLVVLAGSALTLAGAAPARAYVPEKTPRRDIDASARRALGHPATRGALPGVMVIRGARTLFSLNADRPMVPASLAKLATTTVAMKRFGPTHRFPTRVLVPRAAATVAALYLVGEGDPTLATEAYRRKQFFPKPTDVVKLPAFASGSPTVEDLAAHIAEAGIRHVAGDLIADESLFDTRRTQPGWLPRYLGVDPDTGLLSALTVNEGRTDLTRDFLLPSPALGAGEALRRALRARGIRVDGTVRVGRTPASAREIARVESPPLAEIIDYVNRYSINYPAELLLKSLGARFGGSGTTTAGVRVVHDTLAEMKVPLDGFRLSDGSGLSLFNRIAPRTIAAIIELIVTGRGPEWDALRPTIPVAGRPGTLLRRMTRAPAAGNVRGKTGQVRRVRAMAGWATGRDGVAIVYVAMFNRARSPFALTPPLDLLATLLARHPRV